MESGVTSPGVGSVLSRREDQVMRCAAQGMTNAQIAAQLHVSTHAVKFHLAAVYRKLHVSNRTAATARYLAGGVHDDNSSEG